VSHKYEWLNCCEAFNNVKVVSGQN
jgi:hypothetical protein